MTILNGLKEEWVIGRQDSKLKCFAAKDIIKKMKDPPTGKDISNLFIWLRLISEHMKNLCFNNKEKTFKNACLVL